MAKKNKGLKIKQYREPREKYLVVINPWGIFNNYDQADFNHVGAWFELMLQDRHPGVRLRAIYYQRTHRNIIVELPSEVQDIEPYLGAHHYQSFLTNAPLTMEIAYIYEYRYSTFGDPSDKNFSMGHPMYNDTDSIPLNFPVKRIYPPPFAACSPPLDVPYARSIPPEVNERIAARQRLILQAPPAGPVPLSSAISETSPALSKKTIDPRKRPAPMGLPLEIQQQDLGDRSKIESTSTCEQDKAFPSGTIEESFLTKTDPYEADHLAESQLHSTSVAKEDEANVFLDNLFPKIEEGGDTKPVPGEYTMSDALRDAIDMLGAPLQSTEEEGEDSQPNIKPEPMEVHLPDKKINVNFFVKPEPIEGQLPAEDNYTPSAELAAAWSSLMDNGSENNDNDNLVGPIKSEVMDEAAVEVKYEPIERPGLYTQIKDEPTEPVLPVGPHSKAQITACSTNNKVFKRERYESHKHVSTSQNFKKAKIEHQAS